MRWNLMIRWIVAILLGGWLIGCTTTVRDLETGETREVLSQEAIDQLRAAGLTAGGAASCRGDETPLIPLSEPSKSQTDGIDSAGIQLNTALAHGCGNPIDSVLTPCSKTSAQTCTGAAGVFCGAVIAAASAGGGIPVGTSCSSLPPPGTGYYVLVSAAGCTIIASGSSIPATAFFYLYEGASFPPFISLYFANGCVATPSSVSVPLFGTTTVTVTLAGPGCPAPGIYSVTLARPVAFFFTVSITRTG